MFIVYTHFDYLRFFYSTDGDDSLSLSSDTKITTDWTHLIIRLQPDNRLNYFINAVEDANFADVVSINTFEQPLYYGSLGTGQFYNGFIDSGRVYNRALSYNEIKKHYALLRLDKKRQPLLRL